MIHTAKQLKDLIRNLSRENKVAAHILMRNYMMERFLERVAMSSYRDNFILKGGMLVAAMVGIDARATMDMDATVKGYAISVDAIDNIINQIITMDIDDGVEFRIKNISEIMDDAEYSGIRVGIETVFDGVITPLKIDISTGDAITPREIQYEFKLLLEDRKISVWAYPLETVLAEKLETLITRSTTNTRMRDFYDIYILLQMHGENFDTKALGNAIDATTKKRGSMELMKETPSVLSDVASSEHMQKLWQNYQKKFNYAAGISWHDIMDSVHNLCTIAKLTVDGPSVPARINVVEPDRNESRKSRKARDDFER